MQYDSTLKHWFSQEWVHHETSKVLLVLFERKFLDVSGTSMLKYVFYFLRRSQSKRKYGHISIYALSIFLLVMYGSYILLQPSIYLLATEVRTFDLSEYCSAYWVIDFSVTLIYFDNLCFYDMVWFFLIRSIFLSWIIPKITRCGRIRAELGFDFTTVLEKKESDNGIAK